jgi:hypothetical protein
MHHLYSLEVVVEISKPVEVKLPAGIANLFEVEQEKGDCTVSGEFGPYHKLFKVNARTKNEADVKVEDRALGWLTKLNNRFDHWHFVNYGLTYLGEVQDDTN